jgi:hypothetical protein
MSDLCDGPLCSTKYSHGRRWDTSTRLCQSCRAGLSAHLAILPNLYRRCESLLVGSQARSVDRVHGGLPAGINLNEGAVAMRTEMRTVLASWACLVVDEHGMRQPPGRDVPALAGYLSMHLGWLTAHVAAADAATEIEAVVRDAENMLSSGHTARVELGSCERPGCGSVVSVAMDGDGGMASRVIECARGHVPPPHRWLMLKEKFDRARQGTRVRGDDEAECVR